MAYVGKTSRGLDERRRGHIQTAQRNKGFAFAAAIREFGPAAFEWSELFLSDDDACLLEAEQAIIGRYERARLYNMCGGGQGPTGIVWSDERRAAFASGRKGMKFSEAHKASMSLCRLAVKMPKWTEERRAKVAATWAARRLPVPAETRDRQAAAAKARAARDGHAVLAERGRKGAAARWGK